MPSWLLLRVKKGLKSKYKLLHHMSDGLEETEMDVK